MRYIVNYTIGMTTLKTAQHTIQVLLELMGIFAMINSCFEFSIFRYCYKRHAHGRFGCHHSRKRNSMRRRISFCEDVIIAKETVKRKKEYTSPFSSCSRWFSCRWAQTDLRPPWQKDCGWVTWGSQSPNRTQARDGGGMSNAHTQTQGSLWGFP